MYIMPACKSGLLKKAMPAELKTAQNSARDLKHGLHMEHISSE
jgi:hypothetical protein